MTAEEYMSSKGWAKPKHIMVGGKDVEKIMEEYAIIKSKYHVKKALKQANKEFLNQHLEIDDRAFDKMGEIILDLKCQKRISKDILNAYPLSNIV